MDAIACEQQFLDHLAPIWLALPPHVRGRFLVDAPLLQRARAKGIDADLIEAQTIRESFPQQPPRFDGPPCLVASIGDVKVARRLGYGPFVFLEHGAGQWYGEPDNASHSSYSGGPDHDDVGLFLVPNETVAERWRGAYPASRVAVVGSPKVEGLPVREPGPGPTIALAWHWPAPTSIGWGFAGTAWPEYREAVAELAKRFVVIGHQHPNWLQPRSSAGAPSLTYAKLGIPFVEDFEDVCRMADVYVCDNSSTIWEFAATGRPVVVVNATAWAKARSKVEYGLRFWSEADVGVNCDRPADLVAAVEQALADAEGRRTAREAAVSRVYAVRQGGAQLAAEAIQAWLAAREEVAA